MVRQVIHYPNKVCNKQYEAENKRLEGELEELRWIPVEERLPDRKGLYLVLWCNINDGNTQLRACLEYEYDKNDDWGFTHWRYIILPKPKTVQKCRSPTPK